MNRSYDQLCPVAVSLDLVGDRWVLLLLRDLLWHGPMRFGEIEQGNPGLSTSLLTARLRQLEDAGLVERIGAARAGHYRLTPSGQRIQGVIDAFYEFGGPLLAEVPLRPEMLDYVVRLAARRRARQLLQLDRSGVVRLDIDGCHAVLAVGPGSLRLATGTDGNGDAATAADADDTRRVATGTDVDDVTGTDADGSLRCAQPAFVGILAGTLTLDEAVAAGSATVTGDTATVRLVTDLLASEPS